MRTFVFASTLLALCASAFSQNTAPPTQRIQPLSTDTQTTAFFYQKPVVLERSQPATEKQDEPARKSSKAKAP